MGNKQTTFTDEQLEAYQVTICGFTPPTRVYPANVAAVMSSGPVCLRHDERGVR